MAFNINQFRARARFDWARGNLFDVKLIFPPVANAAAASQDIPYKAYSAQLPGSTLGMIVTHYMGREVKFAGNRTFQAWTVNIYNDEDFLIKNAFERWHGAINSHGGNLRDSAANNPLGYTADVTVRQYSKTGDVLKVYTLLGAFPIDVTPIDVAWGNNDSAEEFSVTFEYQYWTTSGASVDMITTDEPATTSN